MKQPTVVLSQAQIDFFHREGYLALHAITDAAEVTQLQGIYDRLFATKAGRAAGDHLDLVTTDEDDQVPVLPQILNPANYAPELVATRFRANALAIAKQLLGADAVAGGDHAILKPPHTAAATPWHQDEAYWDADKEYASLSIWIPLQPATLENGCMQFIPGTHRQEVLPHHPIGNDVRVIGLEVDDVDTVVAEAVACPLPAGGATIHHSRTLHYTGPNATDQPRRAYIMSFGLPAKLRPVARDFYWQRLQKTQWHERAAAAQGTKATAM
jgi:ectoine hydroxylase-related dioxygenase (phytanoyl-CoA dioxygenase family)